MQKYFLHKDGRQLGPYSKEELAQIRITRDTMLWCEGQADWAEAKDIEELSDLFRKQPPPFKEKSTSPPPFTEAKMDYSSPITNPQEKKEGYSTLKVTIGTLVICGIAYFVYGNYRMKQDALQHQVNSQQQYIQEQEAADQAEQERLAEEERQREIQKLKRRYDEAVTRLRAANIKLDQLQEFHFLRTPSEKQEQIENQLEVIRSWENEVEQVRNRLNQY
ncbi:MAG: GYF domain-containing protein [Crocinitomicaceae bacterium]|nr:GYF domain-containing protein [Crocinitomicaceae bacterium]